MSNLELKRMSFSAVLMSTFMSAVLSLYWTVANMAGSEQANDFITVISVWGVDWLISFLIACPSSLLLAPMVRYLTRIAITEVN